MILKLEIKEVMNAVSCTVMSFKPVIDPSDAETGAIFLRGGSDGVVHTVCYLPRKFSGHPKVCSTVKNKALTLIWALEHFEAYLSSAHHPVTVWSNHHSYVSWSQSQRKWHLLSFRCLPSLTFSLLWFIPRADWPEKAHNMLLKPGGGHLSLWVFCCLQVCSLIMSWVGSYRESSLEKKLELCFKGWMNSINAASHLLASFERQI